MCATFVLRGAAVASRRIRDRGAFDGELTGLESIWGGEALVRAHAIRMRWRCFLGGALVARVRSAIVGALARLLAPGA
jgi:hypothetical protein